MDWLGQGWGLWLVVAAIAAVAELVVPGVFLGFVAIGAVITAALAAIFPELGLGGQLISVAAWTAVSIAIGKRWYGGNNVESSQPHLNDPTHRLIGASVVVTQAIEGGDGRVRVGDGEWSARGPDAPVGARLRVIAVDHGILLVEPPRSIDG